MGTIHHTEWGLPGQGIGEPGNFVTRNLSDNQGNSAITAMIPGYSGGRRKLNHCKNDYTLIICCLIGQTTKLNFSYY